MNKENLISYLNDHLAGSVAALQLLEHMRNEAEEQEFQRFCACLHDEVQSDQGVLEGLIHRLGAEQEQVKMAAAWLFEKVGWAKLRLSGAKSGCLQSLEGLALGIAGKRALWVALATLPDLASASHCDFSRLIQRADDQFGRVEIERIKAVKAAFS